MRRRNQITESWAARPIEMLESPAYRVLSLSAHRVLSRIEIEFAHHAGAENGRLVVTFDDFASYGVRRHSIGPALIELEALGFIAITEHGRTARAAEYRRPNKYQLLSRPKQKGIEAINLWRRFKTIDEAKIAVAAVQEAERTSSTLLPERKSRQCRNGTVTSAETALESQNRQCRNGTTVHGRNGTTIYISGRNAADNHCPTPTRPTAEPSRPATAADPSANPADLTFPIIDGVYRITGRAEPVVILAEPRRTLSLAKPSDVAVHEGLAR